MGSTETIGSISCRKRGKKGKENKEERENGGGRGQVGMGVPSETLSSGSDGSKLTEKEKGLKSSRASRRSGGPRQKGKEINHKYESRFWGQKKVIVRDGHIRRPISAGITLVSNAVEKGGEIQSNEKGERPKKH